MFDNWLGWVAFVLIIVHREWSDRSCSKRIEKLSWRVEKLSVEIEDSIESSATKRK